MVKTLNWISPNDFLELPLGPFLLQGSKKSCKFTTLTSDTSTVFVGIFEEVHFNLHFAVSRI